MTTLPLLDTIAPFVRAGWAIHWLHPKSKRPIGKDWSERAVLTLDALRATYQPENNIGVRLGEPSRVDGGYLHVIDVDIRVPDLADEALAKLRELFPQVDEFPAVISGSGGASRHYYFITSKAFQGRKLAVSGDKFRKPGGKWSYTWEIDLFGSGRQVVLPPSIHPDTGQPYQWERPFDFDLLDLGFGPTIPAEQLDAMAVAETHTHEYESREPLAFAPGQLERDLDAIPLDCIDDRDSWITLGQALHHQFGGSDEGFELWMRYSEKSSKFLAGSSRKAELRRYRGFGRNRRKPVTMATIRLWAKDAQDAARIAELDDLDDEPETAVDDEFDNLLGGDSKPTDLDDFDAADAAVPKDDDLEWKSLLEFNEKGVLKGTLHNVEVIITNDPRLAGLPQINLFTMETVQRRAPSEKSGRSKAAKPTRQLAGQVWKVKDSRNGDLWSSARDYAVRSILEAPKTQGGYSVKISDRDLKAATVLAAWKNAFHPVQEYLSELHWDGKPRAERLFVEYLGTPDTPFARDAARLMLIAGVARIFEPGMKFDFAVILEGAQGIGKSSFIRALAKHWAGELDGDFHDPKGLVEKMQGGWLLEMPELSGFNRSDVQAIKAFISRPMDRVRLAYEARAATFPRQCLFIGSTNDQAYLRDPTGNRRFWPVECRVTSIDTERLRREVDQVWAEAVVLYRQMRAHQPHGNLPLYLADKGAAREAIQLQEARRIETVEDATAAQIAAWLDKPVQSGSIDDDRLMPEVRQFTCLTQLWCEALGNDRQGYNATAAQMMGRSMALVPGWKRAGDQKEIAPYARGRYYRRVEAG